MYNDVITLISETVTVDEYGNEDITPDYRDVFADVKSVGMREFYAAAQTDYKPECTAVLADYRDYEDEKLVEWNGDVYHLVRTYRKGKQLELTLERRIGDLDIGGGDESE